MHTLISLAIEIVVLKYLLESKEHIRLYNCGLIP